MPAMPVLGDDFDEGGPASIDRYDWMLPFVSLIFVLALVLSRSDREEDVEDEDDEGAADRGVAEVDELDVMEDGLLGAPPDSAQRQKRKHSIAHDDIVNNQIVYIHVDVEDGGDECGLLQISAVFVDHEFNQLGTFDSFIRPPEGAKWNTKACEESHGYKETDDFIVNASGILDVWPRFKSAVEGHLDRGRKVGMLLAWAGKGSDCSKLFHVTEVGEHSAELDMPSWVKYFCDPCKMIQHYKSCPLNEKKRASRQKGYGLGTVYAEAFEKELEGAHNSLKDAQAQADIAALESVRKFIDKPTSVELLSDIWSGKRKRVAETRVEPTRAVPFGWTDSGTEEWTPPPSMQYTGPSGGGIAGPTSSVTNVCRNRVLSDLFMFFFTVEILQYIADETNRYGNEQWVRQASKEEWRSHYHDTDDEHTMDTGIAIDISAVTAADTPEGENKREPSERSSNDGRSNDGGSFTDDDSTFSMDGYSDDTSSGDDSLDSEFEAEPKKATRLIPCKDDHPERRKRFQHKSRKWIPVTVGYLLAWLGILIIMAAMRIRKWDLLWMETQGINVAFIQNTMTYRAFKQIKSYIHFADNTKLKKPGQHGFNPLQKIQPIVDKILKRFRAAYTMGQFMSADESMIKYKGKAVKFVQYMPAKPIKHGIKVFAICCADTGYIYAFYVYCGKEFDNCSATEVIKRLLAQDPHFLTNSTGRVLYTDNYYTSEELMEMLYKEYGILLVGTVSLTQKKSRSSADFAFHKLSNGAKKLVPRGWLRWAQKAVKDGANRGMYFVQNTTWMDRKQVGVLHNWKVGPPKDSCRILRWCRELRKRQHISSHEIVQDYIDKMRGVDRIDRMMADYNMSMKGKIFYRRIFYYTLTAAVADMRITTKMIVEQAMEQARHEGKKLFDAWAKYTRRESAGVFEWMMDMGRCLIARGISMDWTDLSDDSTRPEWMRQIAFKPCSCKKCFFCQNHLTTAHGPPRPVRERRRSSSNSKSPSSLSVGTPSSLPGTPRQPSTSSFCSPVPSTHKRHKGSIRAVVREHTLEREDIFDSTRNCVVCMEEGRKRKGSIKDGDEETKVMNMTRKGCPHLACRCHAVCAEHWPQFRHS
ncbi:hypothetical protein ACHAWF_015821 [Thalassiosira exigua]